MLANRYRPLRIQVLSTQVATNYVQTHKYLKTNYFLGNIKLLTTTHTLFQTQMKSLQG